MSDTPLNQTDFAGNQPLFDKETAPKQQVPVTPVVERPIHKPKPILFLVIIIIVMAFIAALVLTFQKTENPRVTSTTPTATPGVTTQSNRPPELQQALDQYQQDVKHADPATNDLPIPPVNFSLHFASPTP